jgi:ubiquinol-cytochrome c reductase cytochrome b subunit
MRIYNWIEERLPITWTKSHISQPLPRHMSWLFSLGAVVLFLLLLQAATGAFMSLYYSPSPEHAYNSIQYITNEVTFGKFIRGLHHYGASAMVIAVFLHLLRVFYFASYKRPREVTWIVGVFLLLVVFGFGFTGYLLPWDQKAYWATMVGTQIPGTVPIIGKFIMKVLQGGEDLGAVTLTRFYALHIIFLPAIVFLLASLHLLLIRIHGTSGLPRNTQKEMKGGKPFYPNQIFEDSVACLLVFIVLALFAFVRPVPMEAVADPTDATFIPRPDWYFLFLFQLLKYYEGPYEIIGTFIIPNLLILLLIMAPFLDRKPDRRIIKRPIASGVFTLLVIGVIILTFQAWLEDRGLRKETEKPPPPPTDVIQEEESIFELE